MLVSLGRDGDFPFFTPPLNLDSHSPHTSTARVTPIHSLSNPGHLEAGSHPTSLQPDSAGHAVEQARAERKLVGYDGEWTSASKGWVAGWAWLEVSRGSPFALVVVCEVDGTSLPVWRRLGEGPSVIACQHLVAPTQLQPLLPRTKC